MVNEIGKLFRTDIKEFTNQLTLILIPFKHNKLKFNNNIDEIVNSIYKYDLQIGKKGFIYCLYNEIYEKDTYKLGLSKDPKSRLGSYTTAYPTDSKFIYLSTQLNNCVMAEKILFDILAEYRFKDNREFFKCSTDKIKDAFNQIEDVFSDSEKCIYLTDIKNKINENVLKIIESTNIFNKATLIKISCVSCNKIYSSPSSLSNHKKICKKIKEISNQKIKKTLNLTRNQIINTHTCTYCNRNDFVFQSSLSRHIKSCGKKAELDKKNAELQHTIDILIKDKEYLVKDKKNLTQDKKKLQIDNKKLNKNINKLNKELKNLKIQ
jgi:hypothetical protein